MVRLKRRKELVNYGASVDHLAVRRRLQDLAEERKPGTLDPDIEIVRQAIPESTYKDFLPTLLAGVNEGAIGIGSATQYAPGITRPEMLNLHRLAADVNMCVFTHIRYGSLVEPDSTLEAIQEAIANAAISGGCVHVVHINSMAMSSMPEMIEVINAARHHGVDVSTEMYPWDASNDRIRSVIFEPGWEERWGVTPQDLQSKATGNRLTRDAFNQLLHGSGDDRVLMHMNTEEVLIKALQDPDMIVASDAGTLRDRYEHPRTAGTNARILGHFVREKGAISLMDAIRKMSLLPAQRLEDFVPAMRHKGRVQIGADADLVVFDPNTVASGANYLDAKQFSKGFEYVTVNGTLVVHEGAVVPDAYPGRPLYSKSRAN
jgi:dihydroorotase